MTKKQQPPKEKKCPLCSKAADEKFRPFCSKHCADVDLNRWLSGVYSLPAQDDADDSLHQDEHEES